MDNIKFEWDNNKSVINQKKHNISFEEATTVFSDDDAIVVLDIDHSQEEERFTIIGLSVRERLLMVCHCYKESDTVIRVISARKATTQEKQMYYK